MSLQYQKIVIFLLLTVTLSRANPITIYALEVEDEDYRLSNDVIPVNYDLKLVVPNNFEYVKTYDGIVDITVRTKEVPQTYKKIITLHSKDLVLKTEEVKLYKTDDPKKQSLLKTDDPLKIRKELEMVEFNIDDEKSLEKDSTYILKIPYTGLLRDDMYGFYLSSYLDNEKLQWVAATHFQPTYARRAFPCFDEPNLKATFDISITHAKDYEALSNTKGQAALSSDQTTATTTFQQTPVMSTYLIAFVISRFPAMTVHDDNIVHGAWSQRDLISQAEYGIKTSPKILNSMKQITGISYAESGLSKLDHVAIPDFAAGAMENWGLVIYRETALLWDSEESSARSKQSVAATVAHELAHMWFGNLITLDWWSSTWLNEGFAAYFQYYALDKVETEWELRDQFIVERQPVFNSDSLSTAQALTSEVFTPAQIMSKFDLITYSKGASIICMMEHFMGEESFLKGIKEYLKKDNGHHFKNTVPNDLWSAMSKHVGKNTLPVGVELKDVMTEWTEKPGFPVVTVSTSGNKVFLEAERFLFDKKEEDSAESIWYIPISYTTSDNPNFESTAPTIWLKPKSRAEIDFELTEEFWIIVNIQASAYIRVNYDEKLWKALQTALQKNPNSIHFLNRAQIADDIMNLARAGIVSYTTAFDVNLYLENEKDYYPWYSAFNAFSYLRRRIDSGDELADYLNTYILNLMTQLYKSVSFESKPQKQVEILKKGLALTWACQLNVEECIKKCLELFKSFKENQIPVDPDLRNIVYCTALRNSEEEEDWKFLRRRLTETRVPSETITIISALGCTRTENLLKAYLAESIDPTSDIRRQDSLSVFTAVISGNPEGISVGLEFLKENYEKIRIMYGGVNALAAVISSVADKFTTQEQVKNFEQFVKETDLGEAAAAAESAVESSKDNLKWVATYREELLEYLKEKGSAASSTTESTSTSSTTERTTVVTEGEETTTNNAEDTTVVTEGEETTTNNAEDTTVVTEGEDTTSNTEEATVVTEGEDTTSNTEETTVVTEGEDTTNNAEDTTVVTEGEDTTNNTEDTTVVTEGEDTTNNTEDTTAVTESEETTEGSTTPEGGGATSLAAGSVVFIISILTLLSNW